MVQLSCQCLNVQIDCIGPLRKDKPNLRLTEEHKNLEFFSNGYSEVTIGSAGISQVIPCLCQSNNIGEWIVHSCVNCKMSTHALHSSKGLNRVLASHKLQDDLNKLKDCPEYSAAFKMVLLHKVRSNDLPLSLTSQNPVVKAAVESLSMQLVAHLKEQQKAMDARIKAFIDEEHKSFALIREKANRDKNLLASIVATQADHTLEESLVSAAEDVGQLSLEADTSTKFNDIMTESNSNPFQRSSVISKPREVDTFNTSRRKTAFDRHFSVPSSNFDEMFAMEGLDANRSMQPEDEEIPYYNSDDDLDTDESSLNDESFATASSHFGGMTTSQYATSLPVSMPAQMRSRHSSEEDQFVKIAAPANPQEMEASIKAMARSVKCSDGTEMFGDLPDNKSNLADIALSRISTFNKKH